MYIYILTCKNIMNVMNVMNVIYIYIYKYTQYYIHTIFFSTPQSLMMIPSTPGVFTQMFRFSAGRLVLRNLSFQADGKIVLDVDVIG